MSTAELVQTGLSDTEHGAQLRRAVVASTVGTVIEAYDFLLYGLVAPLAFGNLYFPSSDPLVGTITAGGPAVDRDGAARLDRIGLRDCALCSAVCRRHLRLGTLSAGSGEPRHLATGRLTNKASAGKCS